jgi:hypothetical protein
MDEHSHNPKIFDVFGHQHLYAPVREILEDRLDPGLVLLIASNKEREGFAQEFYREVFEPEGCTWEEFQKIADRLASPNTEKGALSFASEKHTEILIASAAQHAKITREHADDLPIRAVVVLWAYEEDVKYVSRFAARFPRIPIYILCPNDDHHEEGVFERVSSSGKSLRVASKNARVKQTHYVWKALGLERGTLAHFGGPSSQGKSPVTIDLLARMSDGADWPDGEKNTDGPRRGLLMNSEDSYERKILPRFRLAGGNPELLEFVEGTRVTGPDESHHDSLVRLDEDLHMLCDFARKFPDLGLVVIDPITSYLGKLKMNAEEDVRRILAPLAKLAEELNTLIITVGHLNKNATLDPLQRMMGAAAFAGVARSVYMFGPDPDELGDDRQYRHIISPVRGEMEKSWKYSTQKVEQTFEVERGDGTIGQEPVEVIKVLWHGTSKATAEDAANPISKKEGGALAQAGAALKQFLSAGKRSASDCQSFIKNSGSFALNYDHPMTWSRVRKAAGAEWEQKDRQSWWFLRSASNLFEPPSARSDDGVPKF